MKSCSKKLKRGMSLVEIVVSMFIITLISATAISTITLSAKNDQKSIRDIEVALATQTTIDCFNYATDFDEFYNALVFVDEDYKKSQDDTTITLEKQAFILSVVADFNAKVITISAEDKGGKSLSNLSYQKG